MRQFVRQLLAIARCPIRSALTTLLIASAVAVPRSTQAQNWDRYQPGTLTAIIGAHDSMVRAIGSPEAPHYAISGNDFATRARLVYTGERRPISEERRALLQRWITAFGMDSTVLSAFPTEFRFQEDSLTIWLPVQNVLEDALHSEVRPGRLITCYVIFIGGYYAGGPVTWLFLLNEFDPEGG